MNSQAKSQVKREFELIGLDCSNCAMKIENGVKKIDGISSCSVSFATRKLLITMDKASEVAVIEKTTKTIKSLEPKINIIDLNEQGYDSNHGHEHATNEVPKLISQLVVGGLLLAIASLGNFGTTIDTLIFVVAYLVAGYGVVLTAIKNIFRGRVFDEYFLMASATIGAFIIGEYPEAVAVMLFYQLGELFQSIAVNRSRKSISDLMDIRPDYAHVKRNGSLEKVSPNEVSVGDIIVVKPGEKVPLDGVIHLGNSALDTSALTGESLPREVSVDDEVLSGFVNRQGVLEIEVSKSFGESTVSKILDLVQNASNRKAATENFITKFARVYTPIVVVLALFIAILPPLLFSGELFSDWIYRSLVFLVISCPCALVVSVPLGFFGGIGAASRNGILVKGSNFLEALNDVRYVVFDKTGTLTKGAFKVVQMVPSGKFSEAELLKTAAYAEKMSNHPIALSIQERFGEVIETSVVSEYTEVAGHGIEVLIEDEPVLAGNKKLMAAHNIDYLEPSEVGTVVHLAKNNIYMGYIVIADELKEDSPEAIANLKKLGIKQNIMLTGDAKAVAQSIAKQLNLDDVHAELLPHQKVEKFEQIEQQKQKKEKTIFVGDGINDAPVLARADVGIAMGGLGSDAAIEAADIVIMTDEPSKIASAIQVAKRTRKIVWQNIILALGIKAFFLLLGAFGIATMWEAVIADVGVTLLAVLNATRVLRIKI